MTLHLDQNVLTINVETTHRHLMTDQWIIIGQNQNKKIQEQTINQVSLNI